MKPKQSPSPSASTGGKTASFITYYLWPLLVLSCAFAWLVSIGYWNETGIIMESFRGLLPIGPHFLANMGRNTFGVAVAITAFLIIDTIGLGLLKFLSVDTGNAPARLSAAPLAYGILSLFLLGTVLLGLWYVSLLFGILALLLSFSLSNIRVSASYWKDRFIRLTSDGDWPEKALLVFLSLCLFVPLFIPDLNIDSIKYHLSCPQQYLASHKFYSDNTYWTWKLPMVIEYPYAYFLAVGLESSLKIVVMLLAITGILGVIRALPFTVRPIHSYGIIGASLLLHQAGYVLWTAKNDLGVVAVGMAATGLIAGRLYSIPRSGLRTGYVLLIGFLLGMFSMAKFMVLPLAFMLALVVIFSSRRPVFSFLVVCTGAAATVLPWSIKSFLFTQDPLYPYFTTTFPGFIGNSFNSLITTAELHAFIKFEDGLPSISAVARNLGPMIILLAAGLPALFLRGGRGILVLASAGAIGIAIQIGLHRQIYFSRYAYYVTVLWSLAGLTALLGRARYPIQESRTNRYGAFLVPVLLVAVIGLGFIKAYSYQPLDSGRVMNYADYFSGRLDTAGYQSKGLFSYGRILPMIPRLNGTNGTDYSIIQCGDQVSINSPMRIRNDALGPHPIWAAVYESDNINRLYVKFRQMNARFLIYASELATWESTIPEPCSWTPRMLGLYSAFVGRYYHLIGSSGIAYPYFGSYWLYEIADSPHAPLRPPGFLPGADRASYKYTIAMSNIQSGNDRSQLGMAEKSLKELSRQSRGAVIYDSQLGVIYYEMKRYSESLRLLKRALDAGIFREKNLLIYFTMAAQNGNDPGIQGFLEKTIKWYPGEREMIKKVCDHCSLKYSFD